MPVKQFEACMRRRMNVIVVDLHGQIDGFAGDVLNAAYTETERMNPDAILLNFADVIYVNSTGIALIVGLLAKARASKRRLLACCLSDHNRAIFTITRLSDFVSVFPDEASALTEAAER